MAEVELLDELCRTVVLLAAAARRKEAPNGRSEAMLQRFLGGHCRTASSGDGVDGGLDRDVESMKRKMKRKRKRKGKSSRKVSELEAGSDKPEVD